MQCASSIAIKFIGKAGNLSKNKLVFNRSGDTYKNFKERP
jgi:hypothetical protein